MIKQTDIGGRLRLFRYGLIVVVVVTFMVSLLAPYFALRGVGQAGVSAPPLTDFLGTAVLFTIVVAIVAAVAYVAYHYALTKTLPFGGGKKSA
jgi:membrane-anchored glycerophosphoryl diester phosphodiesterase (GDPDase)